MHFQPGGHAVCIISQIQGGNASSNDQKIWISTLQIQDASSEGVIALQQYNKRGQEAKAHVCAYFKPHALNWVIFKIIHFCQA